MKLYKVSMVVDFVVAAENENDAEVKSFVSLSSDEHGIDVQEIGIEEINNKKDIPKGWVSSCLPFGVTDSKRIADYLKE